MSEGRDDAPVSVDRVFGDSEPAPVSNPLLGSGQSVPVSAQVFGSTENPLAAGEESEQSEKEGAPPPVNTSIKTLVEWVAVVVVAISAALLIKEFAFQAFEIPSASMEPTVVPGDRILVNKISYRFGEVQRGDLVVFDRLEGTPGNTDQLIKRAIALPGETIELRDGELWIIGSEDGAADGFVLDEPYLAVEGTGLRAPTLSLPVAADLWNENCLNEREPGRCELDEFSYFLLGDNRGSSTDSRFFGPVPDDHLVGRAFLRIWPPSAIGGFAR